MSTQDTRPQRLHMSSRYRRHSAAAAATRGDAVDLTSERAGYPGATLSTADHKLAQLFDGSRDAQAICALAREQGRELNPLQLEGFAAELARAGLLWPGTHEALPVLAYTPAEAKELGWTGETPGIAGRPIVATPLPPSSVPGSRGNPGLMVSRDTLRARDGEGLGRPLAPEFFIALGRGFNALLRSAAAIVAALAVALAVLVAMFSHRHAFEFALRMSWRSGAWLWQLLPCILIVHAVSTAARAQAIAMLTPERPRLFLRPGFLRLPFLFVDSDATIQRAPRAQRLRLIGAPLLATLLLLALAGLAWLMLGGSSPRLGQFSAWLAVASTVGLLMRLNPLANRDGYLLLSHGIGILDLREQAVLALFGVGRPWSQQMRKLPTRWLALYAILSGAFVLAVLAFALSQTGHWLGQRFGGIGFVLFAGLIGAYMFRQLTKDRIAAARDTLGWKQRDWKPTQREKVIAAVVVLLCCFPYRYSPSGDLVVLPNSRADVRAMVAGDVREVLVQEGEAVKAGQVIARLRDDEMRAQVAKSQAELSSLEADFAVYKRGAKAEEVEVARQRVATAKKRAEVSHDNAQRLKQAFDKQSITAFEYDRARGQSEVDEQSLLEAQRALELTSSPAMADQISAKEAQVAAARALLEFNRKQLADTEIKAPIDGRIVSGSLQFAVGTFLAKGDLLAKVEDSSQLLAEIRLPESSVDEIKPGNGASAKIWAYPSTTFDGEVKSVAPAAEQGEYGKVLRVQMTIEDPDHLLKPEMTGSAKADGDRHLAIVVFTRALRRFLFIEVWSWLP